MAGWAHSLNNYFTIVLGTIGSSCIANSSLTLMVSLTENQVVSSRYHEFLLIDVRFVIRMVCLCL